MHGSSFSCNRDGVRTFHPQAARPRRLRRLRARSPRARPSHSLALVRSSRTCSPALPPPTPPRRPACAAHEMISERVMHKNMCIASCSGRHPAARFRHVAARCWRTTQRHGGLHRKLQRSESVLRRSSSQSTTRAAERSRQAGRVVEGLTAPLRGTTVLKTMTDGSTARHARRASSFPGWEPRRAGGRGGGGARAVRTRLSERVRE